MYVQSTYIFFRCCLATRFKVTPQRFPILPASTVISIKQQRWKIEKCVAYLVARRDRISNSKLKLELKVKGKGKLAVGSARG